jgi:hypothetical protein
VRHYPGEPNSGLFFYTLKETGRTVRDQVKENVSEGLDAAGKFMKNVLTHGPGPIFPGPSRPPRDPLSDY